MHLLLFLAALGTAGSQVSNTTTQLRDVDWAAKTAQLDGLPEEAALRTYLRNFGDNRDAVFLELYSIDRSRSIAMNHAGLHLMLKDGPKQIRSTPLTSSLTKKYRVTRTKIRREVIRRYEAYRRKSMSFAAYGNGTVLVTAQVLIVGS